jgi:hypothetical protein
MRTASAVLSTLSFNIVVYAVVEAHIARRGIDCREPKEFNMNLTWLAPAAFSLDSIN